MRASEVFRPGLLADQVILVTGGGSGIGLEIATECAALGASVAIGGRKLDRLEQAAAELREQGGDVVAGALDIRDVESVAQWLAAVRAHYGRVDVLVNNAGGQFPSAAIDISPKGWRAVIDTNLNGTWNVTQAFAQQLVDDDRPGRIISVVVNMWRGFPGMAHTAAARAGVVNLTKTLSLEWASKGILVNAVAPGIIRSSGLDTYPDVIKELITEEVPQQIPLRRLGTVEDVAWAVAYLAGPGGRYVTGETFCVDGGQAHWGTVFPV